MGSENEFRRTQAWVAGIAAVIMTLGVAAFATPLRRSSEHIQRWVLERAPLGSSLTAVKKLIEEQGWTLNYEWRGQKSHASPRDYPYVKGDHIIGAYFGHYQGIPWRADVDAFWGFDAEERLIDFHVRKDYDSL